MIVKPLHGCDREKYPVMAVGIKVDVRRCFIQVVLECMVLGWAFEVALGCDEG